MFPAVYVFISCLLVLGRSISAEDKLLRAILNESVYDVAIRPPGYPDPDGACVVEIDLLLNSVGPVSNMEMELTMSLYLRQEWIDPRLSYNETELLKSSIEISHRYLDRLWIPDLFFTLGKESYRHDLTTPNILIRLYPNGTVLFSQRITSTMKCFMDLTKFPHDRQNCRCSMMSYGYTTEDIEFRWSSKRSATAVLPTAFLAEFSLAAVSVADCTQTFATGTFTCLEAILTLDREVGYYLTQTYIPSVLIVMLSWAAFWIDHEAVPARISVGLLTVLTITTQSSGARSELPRVSYIKAIDVWMSMNLVFVFAAYMEYAVVTVVARRYKRMLRAQEEKLPNRTDSESTEGSGEHATSDSVASSLATLGPLQQFSSLNVPPPSASSPSSSSFPGHTDPEGYLPPPNDVTQKGRKRDRKFSVFSRKKKKLLYKRNFGRRVDFHSRYLFPLAYLLFNVGYWCVYLLPEKSKA